MCECVSWGVLVFVDPRGEGGGLMTKSHPDDLVKAKVENAFGLPL